MGSPIGSKFSLQSKKILIIIGVILILIIIEKILSNQIKKIKNLVNKTVNESKINLNNLIFFCFCSLCGFFSGLSFNYHNWDFMLYFNSILFAVFYNRYYLFSMVFSQLIAVSFFYKEFNLIFIIFSLIDCIEIILLFRSNKKQNFINDFIKIKTCSFLFLTLVILLVKTFISISFATNFDLINPKNILIEQTYMTKVDIIKKFLLLKFNDFGMYNFYDFLHKDSQFIMIILFKNWSTSMLSTRILSIYQVNVFNKALNKFYYIGTIICFLLFNIFLYLNLYFLTMIVFYLGLNCIILFALLGYNKIFNNINISIFFFTICVAGSFKYSFFSLFLFALIGVLDLKV